MNKDATKYMFAESVKKCMKTMSVEKMTVTNIVEGSDLSRQTFYRNFQDKYDLLNWYFDRLVEQAFEMIGTKTDIYGCLVKKLNFIKDEKVFFSAAFKSDGYNSLKEHDFRLILDFYKKLISENGNCNVDVETEMLLEMYCQSSVYITTNWIIKGMKNSSEEMSQIMVDAIPPKLGEVFRKCNLIG